MAIKRMPAGWLARKLDELGTVGRGKSKHRPRDDARLFGGQYPFVQTGNVKKANLYLTEHEQTYSEFGLAQSKLWDPGTLCITIAANIADTAILGMRACFPDSVVGFVADAEKADVRFIKYYIDTIRLQVRAVSHGTTQDNLSLDKLLRFDFVVPSVGTQRYIADILSAYDDLIENNTKRIKILEEMARSLYREWFVQFRFPGHEKVKLVNTAIGASPQGWRVAPLTQVFEIQYGKTLPKAEMQNTGPYPVYGAGGIIGRYTEANIESTTALITSRGAGSGTTWRARRPGFVTNNSFIIRRGDTAPFSNAAAIQLVLEHANIAAVVGGAAQPQLTIEGLSAVLTAVPPRALGARLDELIAPSIGLADTLHRANEGLSATRDILLPRLISGEIDVSSLPDPAA
jgi:type I restriction enzyme, S subunit